MYGCVSNRYLVTMSSIVMPILEELTAPSVVMVIGIYEYW